MSRFIILVMGLSCGLLIANDNEGNNQQNGVIVGLQKQIEEIVRREEIINKNIELQTNGLELKNKLHDLSAQKSTLQLAIETIQKQKSDLENSEKQMQLLREENTLIRVSTFSKFLNHRTRNYFEQSKKEVWRDLRNRE